MNYVFILTQTPTHRLANSGFHLPPWQRREHSQTRWRREPVSSSGPISLRMPSWRSTHAPRLIWKGHHPLTTWKCQKLWEQETHHGRHVLMSLWRQLQSVKGPCAAISLSMVCAQDISPISCFYVPKKWSKYYTLTIWHAVSDYGIICGQPIQEVQWLQGGGSITAIFKPELLIKQTHSNEV